MGPAKMTDWGTVAALLALAVAWPMSASADMGTRLRLQGRLLSKAGTPVPDGAYAMTVRFYAGEKDSIDKALSSHVEAGVVVAGGAFTLTMDAKNKLDNKPFLTGTAAWVGIQVGIDSELSRTSLHQVPYAIRSDLALDLACSGCVGVDDVDVAVLAPYARLDKLAKVATSGAYGDLSGKPTHAQLKTCPAGQVLTGYAVDGTPACTPDKDTTYDGTVFAKSGQNCGVGKVLRGFDAKGVKVCAPIAYEAAIPAAAFKSAEVSNLQAGKLDDGGMPWKDGKQHNHAYDVNGEWLGDAGSDAHVKLYGNSRSMVFRTDGAAQYSDNGPYPFVWLYKGASAAARRMLLDTSGNLWTSNYGWLHERFAASNQSCDGNQVLKGFTKTGAKICVTDANSTYGGGTFALSGKTCPGSSVMRGITSSGQPNCFTPPSAWPAGKYCIFRNGGSCPAGFANDTITLAIGTHGHDQCPGDEKAGDSTFIGYGFCNVNIRMCCK